MADTNIREARTEINAVGVLSEKNLEHINEGSDKECIRGSLTLKLSPTDFIDINIYCNRLTKSGTESKAWAGICTVLEKYQSIADVGEENATVVSVNKGNIQPQTYYSTKTNDFGNSVRYRANFLKTAKPGEEFGNYGCVEGYVKSKREELDKEGNETGRIILTILVPTYDCIEPLDITIPCEIDDQGNNWAELIDSNYEPGDSGIFYIKAVNEAVTVVKEIPMLGGTTREETSTTYNRGILLTGASEPYDEEQAWNDDTIRQALVERETVLEKKKNDAIARANNSGNKSAGSAAGNTTSNTASGSTGQAARKLPWEM